MTINFQGHVQRRDTEADGRSTRQPTLSHFLLLLLDFFLLPLHAAPHLTAPAAEAGEAGVSERAPRARQHRRSVQRR